MRLRTTFLIILIVLFATAGNLVSSLYFTNSSLKKTLEQDMAFAIGIADNLVSTKMHLIKSESAALANRLSETGGTEDMLALMAIMTVEEKVNDFPEISSLTVFNREGTVASYSVPPHEHELPVNDRFIEMVYNGTSIISSPFFCSVKGEYVMNVYTPMKGGNILAVTIPGSTFTDMFVKHRLWQTGNIFMLNEEGRFVGAADPALAEALADFYIEEGEAPTEADSAEALALQNLIQKILAVENGVDSYTFNNEEHLCAYSRIDGSAMGWRVAVSVLLSESPQSEALRGHIYTALISLIIGAAAAFFLSMLTAGPFNEIESQNRTIKAQSAKILEEHERFKLMLDANPLASRLWTRDYELFDCNEAAVKLFGLKNKQEYLDRYFELSPEYQPDGQPTRDKIKALVDEAFEKGICAYDWEYRAPDGTPIPAECAMVRVPYGDGYMVAGYSRDLREHKKMMAEIEQRDRQLKIALADAREANDAKSSFLAHMSHEIRTPLNAVVGLSELAIAECGLDSEMEDKLEKIHASGMTILSIVNDILDISKIESGKFEIYPTQYDTPSLINDIVTLNIVRIGEKPVTFKLDIDENLPGELYGDDLRVKQIFNNLLSNAFKYTHEGTVEWRVTYERDGDDVWLLSHIQDTGIGIEPENLAKLFSEYNQVDISTNRRVEGTGLGLAITKRLVEMMDGTITVESEYGKGSVFSVKIRQRHVTDKPIGKPVAENLMGLRYTLSKRNKNKLARVNLSYAHVLVVDDIPTNLDVVKGMMKPYGLKIDCAISGQQAVDMVRGESPRYSAVFMDHMMPGMDGIEATQIIRKEIGTEYARNVPVIALTANAIVGNEEMFLNKGFQDFISKPIDMAKLDAVLRRWVRDKRVEKKLSGENKLWQAPETVKKENAVSVFNGISIAGMDKDKALERFNGDESILMEVLQSYESSTRNLIKNLRAYLETGDLEDYTITVHGIKASSYAISAQETGKRAEKLEAAARERDYETVRSEHDSFESSAEALLNEIKKALTEIDKRIAPAKPVAASPDRALLIRLAEACKAYDMDSVDGIMEKLESLRYESGGETVRWLREKINEMDFEKIAEADFSKIYEASAAEILVADDNETTLMAAQRLLTSLHMRVDTAANGEEALKKIRGKKYRLVFMDDLMPVMGGIEAVKILRGMEGDYYKTVPVIALTAADAAEHADALLQAGMSGFMEKPASRTKLLEQIRRWLPGELPREPLGAEEHTETELPVIEGVDALEGVLYSGSKKLFIDLLGDFYTLIDAKSDKIEKYLAEGRIEDMVIEAHGLRSAARLIGAKELSAGFARVERSGGEGNSEALRREVSEVLKQYRGFKTVLKPYRKTPEGEKRPAAPGEVLTLLKQLKSAVENFDLAVADEIFKRLEGLSVPEEHQKQMATLKVYLTDVAMEDAIKLTEEMIGAVGT
ncbi:MAG: response regulator [Clostridiales bacterium]|jgi:signal transduction histidine kinase/CheY-like chemotaxis protein|nr:response regulator [Clostridiales bacterium]